MADFALRTRAKGALRYSAKELAKGIFSLSGAAAAVGGGVVGTMAVGAFASALEERFKKDVAYIKQNSKIPEASSAT